MPEDVWISRRSIPGNCPWTPLPQANVEPGPRNRGRKQSVSDGTSWTSTHRVPGPSHRRFPALVKRAAERDPLDQRWSNLDRCSKSNLNFGQYQTPSTATTSDTFIWGVGLSPSDPVAQWLDGADDSASAGEDSDSDSPHHRIHTPRAGPVRV